jgi:uncharacterized protein
MNSYYLESSAAIKLFRDEPETGALTKWIRNLKPSESLISSDIMRVELLGNLGSKPELLAQGHVLLREVTLVPVRKAVLDQAVLSMGLGLRTLDAIHHATAVRMAPDLGGVICYDKRLSNALQNFGLRVISPAG